MINNNCVATLVDAEESIVTGAGVGFQKKPGDIIDETKVEKIFELRQEDSQKLTSLLEEIPTEYFDVAQAIYEEAVKQLDEELNVRMMIGLTDHIYFSLERTRKGQFMPSMFAQEMRLFYPEAYNIGVWGTDLIKTSFGVELESGEAALIATHILNGMENYQEQNVQKTVFFVQSILQIMTEKMEVTIPKDSISHARISLHLKLLAERVFNSKKNEKQKLPLTANVNYLKLVAVKYQRVNSCIQTISAFIYEQFNHELEKEEKLYLSVHMMRLVDELTERKTK